MDNRAQSIKSLKEHAKNIRLNILEMVGVGRAGHLGGSMSMAEIITVLYFYKMSYDPNNVLWPFRDRLILSKGHSALAQYAALCEMGIIPKEELSTVKTISTRLQGHPDKNKCPGIEANTGSLGQGLSICLGMALASRLDKSGVRVYCITGDGELNEGQIWEAAMAAASYKVNNLVCIVDSNHVQATDTVNNVMKNDLIDEKFRAFGWKVINADGNCIESMMNALDSATEKQTGPVVIIAQTIKGKGVDFAEGKASYHNGVLTQEQYDCAKEQILSGE